jgi:hypothetical protein
LLPVVSYSIFLRPQQQAQKKLVGEELTVDSIRDAMQSAEETAPHRSRSLLKRKRSMQPDQLAQLLAEKSRVMHAVKTGKLVLEVTPVAFPHLVPNRLWLLLYYRHLLIQ